MTDQRLRELLDEHVADLTAVDLVDGAWLQSRAVRRRRRATAAAAAAIVAVVGTTAVVVSRGDDGAAPPVTSPSGTRAPSVDAPKAVRAGEYAGAQVWWAPRTEDEVDLPTLDGTPLPSVIDLSDGRPAWPGGMHAVALLQVWGDDPGGVVVVGEDGTSYSLDVSRLDRVRDGGGNDYPPVGADSLSPDGRHAFFRQSESIEVYDLEEGTWTTIELGDAYIEDARWRGDLIEVQRPAFDPDFTYYRPDGTSERGSMGSPWDLYVGPTHRDDPYGPIARWAGAGARGMFLAGPLTDRSGGEVSAVDGLGVGGSERPEALLAFPVNRADDGRWLQCCPSVGWLDEGTVLFESRWAEAKVLAWKVGTPDVYRVSDIVGWSPGAETYVASFAALH